MNDLINKKSYDLITYLHIVIKSNFCIRKKVLTDDFELHIIGLPKIKKEKADGKEEKLLEWLSFLENPESKEVLVIWKEMKI